eukprot:GHRR01029252.1.p1 GENE.GHRR01029252.1~~GHRR01029252.1.p1  ORF type:complete len:109 (-),score=8.92 GHRR01029252.1:742-1068(-)
MQASYKSNTRATKQCCCPHLTMQTYSFPALCCAFTSRVALSTHTIRLPVTLGSSVPLCPVFSTLSIRLAHATTSCEDGLAGLSRFMQPYEMYSLRGRRKGVKPAGIGV